MSEPNKARQASLADPIDPPPHHNPDTWSTSGSRRWYQGMRAKIGAATALLATSIGISLYILSPAEGSNAAITLDDPQAPLISEKALNRLNMNQAESALQCDEKFVGGPKMNVQDEGQRIAIRNLHNFPILLSFFDDHSKEKIAVIGLESKSTEEVYLPVNIYTMEALTGTDWCSMEVGFRHGARVVMKDPVHVSDRTQIRLEFVSDGQRPRDFQPRLIETPLAAGKSERGTPASAETAGEGRPSPSRREGGAAMPIDSAPERERSQASAEVPYQVIGDGSLTLRPVFANNYFVTGTVNGFPVVFTVDPGAPALVLPQHIAARAGVRSCVQRQITTSTGSVRGCAARISDVRFGELRVRNAEALILPTPTGDAVIGMNVLSRFKVVQANATLSISTHKQVAMQ